MITVILPFSLLFPKTKTETVTATVTETEV